VFLHRDYSRRQKLPCYEERITLVRAGTFNEAIRKGEAEAKRYAGKHGECEYLGFIDVFALFDITVKEGSEVYSVMRSIRLSKKEFIGRHYDDGTFHSQRWEDVRDSALGSKSVGPRGPSTRRKKKR
jgi:hypothetical protein